MTTRSELETELVAQLQVASSSTLYPAARITTLIKNAYMWATQLVIWQDLVRAKTTGTWATHERYDYPDEFRSGTIFRLEVDDEEYKRKHFEDYLAFKRNNPSSTKKIFASFARQLFIYPTPTANGSANISAWGAIQADELSAASSEPIFSNSKEDGNEAVVRKAFSVAIRRQDKDLAKSEETEAIAILLKLSTDEQKATQRDQRLQHPMLSVPDYFAGGSGGATPYGKFSYDPEEEE